MTAAGGDASPGAGRWQLPGEYSAVSAVAEAILYEGYLLYPYRKSAAKNRLRWQFGVLAPRAWAERNLPPDEGVAGSAESWFQQTECLMEAGDAATLSLRLRFLHAQQRTVAEVTEAGAVRPVARLEVDGRLLLSFDEAAPLERDVAWPVAELLAAPRELTVEVPGWEQSEDVRDAAGQLRGRVLRRRSPATIAIRASAAPAPAAVPLTRLRVRVENVSAGLDTGASRDEALRRALLAAHTFLALDGGSFLSQLDPPPWAATAARASRNIHTMPVLAGDEAAKNLVLSSPIILYDYPRVAPESPGDLFDAGEIDEILSLRTLTLTDEEKREARATDRRAAEIVDRVEDSAPDVFARLHGTIRPGANAAARGSAAQNGAGEDSAGEGSTPEGSPAADWDRQAPSPRGDVVLVAGVQVGKGSRVRLRPRTHGTDAHDMFLAGRYALVEDVLTDIDGSRFVAVSVEDDPAAELQRALGRFFHFSPDEIEPTGAGEAGPA
jgi:hypothetical protein